MKAKLLVVGGDFRVTEISLELPVIIGRGRDATLTLPHPLVSRSHCELYEDDGKLMVRDLGSLNGTYVGSERIEEAELPAGELLTVATVNFRAVYEDVNEDATNPPAEIANNDSTHNVARLDNPNKPARDRDKESEPSDGGEMPQRPRPPVKGDRDTQWQVGNASSQSDSKDNDDLSSLLNDPR